MDKSSKEYKLALEIANTLDDMDALAFHYSNAQKYSEVHQRKILAKVMSIPERNIRKSRGALYTTLIRQSSSHQ